MKLVTAYVRHESFEPIRTALLEQGLPSLTVSEVKGSGRQKGIVERYRGSELTNHLRPKLKLEIGVSDEELRLVIDTILLHASTGDVGDGKIFVTQLEQAIRIRTGEAGEHTLQAHTGEELDG